MLQVRVSYLLVGPSYLSGTKRKKKDKMNKKKKKNENMNKSRFGALRFGTLETVLPHAGGSASFAIAREDQESLQKGLTLHFGEVIGVTRVVISNGAAIFFPCHSYNYKRYRAYNNARQSTNLPYIPRAKKVL